MQEGPRGKLVLLPPAPDRCQVCATRHGPAEPHNPTSLYWQMARSLAGEPPPTWEEALTHCTPEVRADWVARLRQAGVEVAGE